MKALCSQRSWSSKSIGWQWHSFFLIFVDWIKTNEYLRAYFMLEHSVTINMLSYLSSRAQIYAFDGPLSHLPGAELMIVSHQKQVVMTCEFLEQKTLCLSTFSPAATWIILISNYDLDIVIKVHFHSNTIFEIRYTWGKTSYLLFTLQK